MVFYIHKKYAPIYCNIAVIKNISWLRCGAKTATKTVTNPNYCLKFVISNNHLLLFIKQSNCFVIFFCDNTFN